MIYTTLYLDYIKNNRNLSDWTIKGYKGYLRFFDEYLRRITNHRITIEDCEKIQKIHIENFIAEKMRGGKNPRTINVYISAIKGYLNYCENIGKKICNYRLIERLRESPREIEALKENECGILLNYFRDMIKRNPGKELLYKRNYCICYMLLYLGVRLSELYKLNKKDIKESLLVKGKGRKNRILTLFNEDLEVIKDYLCLRKDDNEALFVSLSPTSYGNRLSRNTIENVIKEGGEGIGIHLFPHKLRHTFATNLLRNNAKLPHIQKLLGHSSLDTTQIYLTVLDDELKETQKLLHRF